MEGNKSISNGLDFFRVAEDNRPFDLIERFARKMVVMVRTARWRCIGRRSGCVGSIFFGGMKGICGAGSGKRRILRDSSIPAC